MKTDTASCAAVASDREGNQQSDRRQDGTAGRSFRLHPAIWRDVWHFFQRFPRSVRGNDVNRRRPGVVERPVPMSPSPACRPAAVVPNPVDDGLDRNVWRHAAGARVALVGSMLLLVASQLVKLGVPWCAAKAIDALQA